MRKVPAVADKALRESEELHRTLVGSALDGIVIHAGGRVVFASRAAAAMLGFEGPDSLVGQPLASTVHPDSLAIHQDRIRRVLAGAAVAYPVEARCVKQDGTELPVECTAALVTYEGEPAVLAVIRDITERKQAESQREAALEALEESEVRFRELFDRMSSGVAIYEAIDNGGDFMFKDFNPAAEKIEKVSRKDVIGRRVSEVFPGVKSFGVFEVFRRVWQTGQSEYFPENIYRDERDPGSWRENRVFKLPTGEIVAIYNDISERKRAEDQLRQLQKTEGMGRMAGAIAHHFNNQLGVVMGNLELALVGLSGDPRVRDNLNQAMQAARRSAEVSGQLLAYLGQTIGNREPLDLSETCRRSLPMLRAVLPKHSRLQADLPFPGPTVSGNANRIQQVLTNLVANAAEAMGEAGGAVLVTVTTVSPDDIPAAHRFPIGWQPQEKAHACLEVRDAGCGIADTDIEKIFDPFFSTKFTGRGLGLPVVLGIVQALGGAVTVESEVDRASVFRVFIPLSAEEVPRRPDQRAPAPEMEAGGTVLLVEDEEMVRDTAAAVLDCLGFTVLAAKDGVEAVEVFRRHQDEIRCVLCDLTMSRMSGWETLAALRKLAPGIPVVLASGYDEASVMAGDHPEQPQVFLPKPYQMAALQSALARAMGGRLDHGMLLS